MFNCHQNKIKVFLICSGLGEVQRGYESFTRECFDALEDEPTLDIYLFKGGGKTVKKQQEYRLLNLKRKYFINQMLSRFTGKDAYYFEQITFFFSLIPYIISKKPQVIYFSDFLLGCWLGHLKKFLNLKYKLLFSNGAPNGPPFSICDHVQQLLPLQKEIAVAAYEPPEKHSVIPYGFHIPEKLPIQEQTQKNFVRTQLGLPEDKTIVLSVGAINSSHKRMDYVIREFSEFHKLFSDSLLLLLGQQDVETPTIKLLASQELSSNSYQIKSVEYKDIKQYYMAADVFVLGSLKEGFGRVIIEAASYGLPVILHDNQIFREVMEEYGIYADFTEPGTLSKAITKVICDKMLLSEESKISRNQFVYTKYSWQMLREKYVQMIKKV